MFWARHGPRAGGDTRSDSAFLNDQRRRRCGAITARLLFLEHSWVERRKESIEILDDTAIRRRATVDFSLRSTSMCRLGVDPRLTHGDIFCVPLFVLPKAPSSLMEFDLVDEKGKNHRLLSRADNLSISAEALVKGAQLVLGDRGLSDQLRAELRALAMADPVRGDDLHRILNRLHERGGSTELSLLFQNERFVLWLRILAHSSIAVTLYRDVTLRRKLFKLSYVERLTAANDSKFARVGWTPYRFMLNVPLVEARSFHFEAVSPPGLRISDVYLIGDDAGQEVTNSEHSRRTHLYLADARKAADALFAICLSPGKPGFLMGAFAASTCVAVALLLILVAFRDEVAESSSSAPAILLVLPGIIATYLGRPVYHALTTRMLSATRWLLVLSGLCAYLGAAATVIVGGSGGVVDPASIIGNAGSSEVRLELLQGDTGDGSEKLYLPFLILSILAGLAAASIGYSALFSDRVSKRVTEWRRKRKRRNRSGLAAKQEDPIAYELIIGASLGAVES